MSSHTTHDTYDVKPVIESPNLEDCEWQHHLSSHTVHLGPAD